MPLPADDYAKPAAGFEGADYRFAALTQDDVRQVNRMEQDLSAREQKEIILLAYEKR